MEAIGDQPTAPVSLTPEEEGDEMTKVFNDQIEDTVKEISDNIVAADE